MNYHGDVSQGTSRVQGEEKLVLPSGVGEGRNWERSQRKTYGGEL